MCTCVYANAHLKLQAVGRLDPLQLEQHAEGKHDHCHRMIILQQQRRSIPMLKLDNKAACRHRGCEAREARGWSMMTHLTPQKNIAFQSRKWL